MAKVTLRAATNALERIAPLSNASSWDNVGLLVEPIPEAMAARILLCIDLTEAVLDEATESSYPLPWREGRPEAQKIR